jgi:hypothetical protein
MHEGNGHPYSWSIIINGEYSAEELAKSDYGMIKTYIDKQPPETLGIPGARITHIWADDPADAISVAKVANIANVVKRPEDVIGEVDAVILATDHGHEHVERARPFIEAGLPVFIDKPLCDRPDDLATFREWHQSGSPFMTSSSMRYAKEFSPYHHSTYELGELRYAMVSMAKCWERYGIHSLSTIYPILGPGFIGIRNTGTPERNIIHLRHSSGCDVNLPVVHDMYGGYVNLFLCGTISSVSLKTTDTYFCFKTQLETFIHYLRTGINPIPWEETEELIRLVIGGIMSRDRGGEEILLRDID